MTATNTGTASSHCSQPRFLGPRGVGASMAKTLQLGAWFQAGPARGDIRGNIQIVRCVQNPRRSARIGRIGHPGKGLVRPAGIGRA